MRYMEKNMRDGHAWSGREVTAQFYKKKCVSSVKKFD